MRLALAPLLLAGCLHFQTGASTPLPPGERVDLRGRGQLRVIDLPGPEGAETVLLVHGYGASSNSWKPILPALRQRFRVLAVDLPGFGKSDARAGDYSPGALADVLAAILDDKGVDKAHVVGHSWGTSVAMAFARRYRARLLRLGIVSGFLYDDQLLPLFRWARAPGLGEALYRVIYAGSAGERLYYNFVDPTQVTEKVVEDVERALARPGALAAALAAARGMRFDDAAYAKVDAETLVLWGREDRVARLPFGERLASELPHARLVVLARCGHLPMWECSGETAQALLDFLGARP